MGGIFSLFDDDPYNDPEPYRPGWDIDWDAEEEERRRWEREVEQPLDPVWNHIRQKREQEDLRLALEESRYESRVLAQRQREVEALAEQAHIEHRHSRHY